MYQTSGSRRQAGESGTCFVQGKPASPARGLNPASAKQTAVVSTGIRAVLSARAATAGGRRCLCRTHVTCDWACPIFRGERSSPSEPVLLFQ